MYHGDQGTPDQSQPDQKKIPNLGVDRTRIKIIAQTSDRARANKFLKITGHFGSSGQWIPGGDLVNTMIPLQSLENRF